MQLKISNNLSISNFNCQINENNNLLHYQTKMEVKTFETNSAIFFTKKIALKLKKSSSSNRKKCLVHRILLAFDSEF